MKEYLNMWKNYVNFKDRTTVRGYWMAFLFNVIVSLILGVIVGIAGTQLSFLSGLYALAIFLPGLAIAIRRLRDAGKAWTNIFWVLVPLAGVIIYIVILCKPSVADDGVPVV